MRDTPLITGLKRHIATRQDRVLTTTICVLLLLVGYLGGHWSANIHTPTPIIFEEAHSEGKNILGDTDLQILRDVSEPPTSPMPVSSVEGSTTIPNIVQTTGSGLFVASVKGAKYYHPDCGTVSRILEENKIWFSSEQEALAAGYEPSKCVEDRR